jgi:putative ATP-dependent endonuclease of OLD family
VDEVFKINTIVENIDRGRTGDIDALGEGLKSIYILSLLETYVDTKNTTPYIIMIEDPETYLHPHLKKTASEILDFLRKIKLYFLHMNQKCFLTLQRSR